MRNACDSNNHNASQQSPFATSSEAHRGAAVPISSMTNVVPYRRELSPKTCPGRCCCEMARRGDLLSRKQRFNNVLYFLQEFLF